MNVNFTEVLGKVSSIVTLPTTKYSWNTVGLNLGLNGKKPELWYILARVR
jgi:hypothetical protein